MQITISDRQTYAINSQRVYTDEGFLRVPGYASRTGIQTYLASELGLPGDPNRLVNVYRPPEEVFADESLNTFLGIDITDDHPSTLVNKDNYRNLTVGVVTSKGRQDNDHVAVDLLIKDKNAISKVESGKSELSVGYTALYDEVNGVAPDGTEYEFVQRAIRCNHLAICQRGRAGTARIFDNKTGGSRMPVNITLDSGRVIDVADAANAQLVADAFDRHEQRVKTAEAARDTAQALYDAAQEQVKQLQQKCSDEAIIARVQELTKVTTLARKVAGDAFKCDSMDTVEIQRAALSVKRPSVDWANKSAAYVEAAFDQASEEEEEETEDAGGNGKQRKMCGDQYQQLAQDASKNAAPVMDAMTAFKMTSANRWKGAK